MQLLSFCLCEGPERWMTQQWWPAPSAPAVRCSWPAPRTETCVCGTWTWTNSTQRRTPTTWGSPAAPSLPASSVVRSWQIILVFLGNIWEWRIYTLFFFFFFSCKLLNNCFDFLKSDYDIIFTEICTKQDLLEHLIWNTLLHITIWLLIHWKIN